MLPPEPAGSMRRMIANFEGAVVAAGASAAVNCRLSGRDRDFEQRLEVHFSGARGAPGPQTLEDVQVFELGGTGEREWLIVAGSSHYRLQARAVQVHRMPATEFFAAVPGEPLSVATRAGWALLLNVLRIPGAARLISWLRSSR